jgi:hypothetical protein
MKLKRTAAKATLVGGLSIAAAGFGAGIGARRTAVPNAAAVAGPGTG